MGKYEIVITPEAFADLAKLRKSEPPAHKKAVKILQELEEHPTTGTGKPKPLGGNRAGQWSRRITDKHRLLYSIEDHILTVSVLTARGHYDDK